MGPPPLGQLGGRGSGDALAGVVFEGTPQAEIGGREGIGLGQAKREVVSGPRTQPGKRGDRWDQRVQCLATVEFDLAAGDDSDVELRH